MKVQFTFTPAAHFDSISIGDVFLAGGNHPYMKIQEITIPSTEWNADMPFNAVSLRSGELDWFDTDSPIVPCPTATLCF